MQFSVFSFIFVILHLICHLVHWSLSPLLPLLQQPAVLDDASDEEVELDIDQLSNKTLWDLKSYVDTVLAQPAGPPKKTTPAGRGGAASKRPPTLPSSAAAAAAAAAGHTAQQPAAAAGGGAGGAGALRQAAGEQQQHQQQQQDGGGQRGQQQQQQEEEEEEEEEQGGRGKEGYVGREKSWQYRHRGRGILWLREGVGNTGTTGERREYEHRGRGGMVERME
jgi:hypothetical protein